MRIVPTRRSADESGRESSKYLYFHMRSDSRYIPSRYCHLPGRGLKILMCPIFVDKRIDGVYLAELIETPRALLYDYGCVFPACHKPASCDAMPLHLHLSTLRADKVKVVCIHVRYQKNCQVG